MVRGTMPGMKPGTILGHEGVGVVEEVGADVRNFKVGDRVVCRSTIACGACSYCRAGYYSQCDNANPNGPQAGTAFFGGPSATGPFDGLQAENARVPFAHVGLVKLPDEVTDDQAILLSDIFPTGYFGAEMAEIDAATRSPCSAAARSACSRSSAPSCSAPAASSPSTSSPTAWRSARRAGRRDDRLQRARTRSRRSRS